MKILVLGGTGAIGIPFVENISKKSNNQVFVTSRKQRISKKDNIHYIVGNSHDISFIESIINKKFDAVVDFMTYSTKEFLDRYELLLKNTKHYIFFSSARVYDECNDIITEKSTRLLEGTKDDEYLATDEYALSKAREEDILLNSKYKNYTIIRPYITYYNNRLQLGTFEKEQWLYRALNNKTVGFPKELYNKYTTLTYAQDVANLLEKCIMNDNTFSKTYNIISSQYLRWKDIIKIYSDVIKELTEKEIKIALIDDEKLGIKRYQYKYDRCFNRKFSSNKICKDLNEKYIFYDIKDGLKLAIKEFINNNMPFNNLDYRLEGKLDRITKEKTNVLKIKSKRGKIIYFIYRYLFILPRILDKTKKMK